VSQLCHLVEFLEPRPYACQLCASRHAASRAATMRTALTVFTSSPSARARPGGGGSAFQLIVPHFSKLLRTLEQPPGAAAVHQAIDRGAAVVARESPPSGPGSRSYSLVMRG